MFAVSGRLNAEDAANLEVEVAQTVVNVALTLLQETETSELAVTVRVSRKGTWGDAVYEKSMTVAEALGVLAEAE